MHCDHSIKISKDSIVGSDFKTRDYRKDHWKQDIKEMLQETVLNYQNLSGIIAFSKKKIFFDM